MLIQHIRWQALIALCGILLLVTLLTDLSRDLDTVVLPEPGGTYIEAIPSRPGNLNPLYLRTRADIDLAGLLFNGLTREAAGGMLAPDLAESWEVSEDNRTYTFQLQEDLLWHDGAPVTAEDVAFTVEVLRNPDYVAEVGDVTISQLWDSVEVEVVDPLTIRFILPSSLAPFAPFLSYTTFGILPRHLLEQVPVAELSASGFSTFPIGTGPWRVVSVDAGSIILEPHPTHPGEPPMLDQLILKFYDDEGSALQAYSRGEVMGIAQLRPDDLPRVQADPSLIPYSAIISGYSGLFFNLKQPGFQNPTVRQALMQGLDRQELIEDVLDGQGLVAHSFLMPTHWAYNADLPHYAYQPEDASQLLEEAGWEDSDEDGVLDQDGIPFRFVLLTTNANPQLKLPAMAEAVSDAWAELGIVVETRVLSAEGFTEALRGREFDMVLLATPVGGLPADPDFYPLWHSSQAEGDGQNYTSFANEGADLLLVEARRTQDFEARRQMYHDFQALLAEELPALPLYHPIYNYAVSNLVQEVQIGPMTDTSDRFQSLPDWYIKVKRFLVTRGEPIMTETP